MHQKQKRYRKSRATFYNSIHTRTNLQCRKVKIWAKVLRHYTLKYLSENIFPKSSINNLSGVLFLIKQTHKTDTRQICILFSSSIFSIIVSASTFWWLQEACNINNRFRIQMIAWLNKKNTHPLWTCVIKIASN